MIVTGEYQLTIACDGLEGIQCSVSQRLVQPTRTSCRALARRLGWHLVDKPQSRNYGTALCPRCTRLLRTAQRVRAHRSMPKQVTT